jgi:hypothetical protein
LLILLKPFNLKCTYRVGFNTLNKSRQTIQDYLEKLIDALASSSTDTFIETPVGIKLFFPEFNVYIKKLVGYTYSLAFTDLKKEQLSITINLNLGSLLSENPRLLADFIESKINRKIDRPLFGLEFAPGARPESRGSSRTTG